MELIDLHHEGRPGLIGAWRIDDVLVDCGPTSCLPALLDGLGEWRPEALLLTHIHFDHAGAAGALASRWPDLKIYVHRSGAKHLQDPSRLMASARRVFGDDFDRLFGGMLPVPPASLRILDGGEQLRGFEVLYTPGHATHHVSFFHESGRAFVGDVAGVRLSDNVVVPPTPPPDIDLDRWRTSIEAVRHRTPAALALTHYGLIDEPGTHLARIEALLGTHEKLASRSSEQEYAEAVTKVLASEVDARALEDYRIVIPLEQNYAGLRRWLESPRLTGGRVAAPPAG